jgi:hypothetical protein
MQQPTIDRRMANVSSAAANESKMTVVGDGQGKGVATKASTLEKMKGGGGKAVISLSRQPIY